MSASYLVQVHPVINSADRGSDITHPSSPWRLEGHTDEVCRAALQAGSTELGLSVKLLKKKNRLGHQFLNWDFASHCSNGKKKKKKGLS